MCYGWDHRFRSNDSSDPEGSESIMTLVLVPIRTDLGNPCDSESRLKWNCVSKVSRRRGASDCNPIYPKLHSRYWNITIAATQRGNPIQTESSIRAEDSVTTPVFWIANHVRADIGDRPCLYLVQAFYKPHPRPDSPLAMNRKETSLIGQVSPFKWLQRQRTLGPNPFSTPHVRVRTD